MTDASTASAAQILEALQQRPDGITILVLLAEALKRALQNHEILFPWERDSDCSYSRKWWSLRGHTYTYCMTAAVVELLTKEQPLPWVATIWDWSGPRSPQFATPEEAQAWVDEQLVAAGYTLLPQGYNHGSCSPKGS